MLVAVLLVSAYARADELDIDVRTAEYLDVIETSDGNVWKGVIVEEKPGDVYRLAVTDGVRVIKAADVVRVTKQKNRERVAAAPQMQPAVVNLPVAMFACTPMAGNDGVVARATPRPPADYARAGVQIDPSLVFVLPQGDIGGLDTSFSPDLHAGLELRFGDVGVTAGGMTRYTYWQLPSTAGPGDADWTLETHAFGRATYHLARIAAFGGVSMGLDTNFIHVGAANMSKTSVGFGMNLESGIEFAATPDVAVTAGFDYHPGTDIIVSGAPGSVSYFGLLAGVKSRL